MPPQHPHSAAALCWLADALARLAPRRRERIAVLEGTPTEAVDALQRAVGSDGLVSPLDATAGRGRFDAVFGGWLRPALDAETCAEHVRQGLRPGGRAVLDLPTEHWNDDLEALRPLLRDCGVDLPTGTAADTLETSLRAIGLRDLAVVARTCVAELDETDELLDLALAAQPSADVAAVRLLLLRRLAGRQPPVATVFRRVQVLAKR